MSAEWPRLLPSAGHSAGQVSKQQGQLLPGARACPSVLQEGAALHSFPQLSSTLTPEHDGEHPGD